MMEKNCYIIKQLNRSFLEGAREYSPLGKLEEQVCKVLGLEKPALHELRTSQEAAGKDPSRLETGLLIFAKKNKNTKGRCGFKDVVKTVKNFYEKREFEVSVGRTHIYRRGRYKDVTLKATNSDKLLSIEVGEGREYRIRIA